MRGKWQAKVDIKSSYLFVLVFYAYLVFLVFWDRPFYSVNLAYDTFGSPILTNNLSNLYLQFIASFFLLLITANMFSQTFERKSAIFIKSLPLSFGQLILLRLVKLIICILIVYLPVVYISFKRTNRSISDFINNFPQYKDFPPINISIPIIHSIIFVIFFTVLIMFVYSIIKKKSLLIIAVVTYLAFEITFLPRILSGKLSIFYETFILPDFYNLFNRITVIQIASTSIMLISLWFNFKNRSSNKL